MQSSHAIRTVALTLAIGLGGAAQGFATAESSDKAEAVFATVNGEPILKSSYLTALRVFGRQRFYHGKPPEETLEAFRQEVAERLVVEKVMHQEAVRRGLEPDPAWIDAEFAKIAQRYSVSPEWEQSGDELKLQIREGLAERNLIDQVDQNYKSVADPGRDEVRAYYETHPDKFTSPERIRVTTILLNVDPWEPREVWLETGQRAETILADIKNGADFDGYAAEYPLKKQELLGEMHRGMLGDAAQAAIDGIQPGQTTGVVRLLEGMAIFRLDERKPAVLNPLDKVYERASALLAREQSEAAYKQRMEQLRAGAEVVFTDPDYFRVTPVVTLQDENHRQPSAVKNE
ncbi:MAG: peptidyl-prolyl cis-trans isomerase [Gammaproteobacteria bacterium]|nr:peptidyl-prolyl cis-trans isomerase [Gammaproteobacteria bacterium]